MRHVVLVVTILSSLFILSCGDGKVYQEYSDLTERYWLASDTAAFSFTIPDSTLRYNVYCNIRNSTHYPYARLFVQFSLSDSSGRQMHQQLVQDFLFDPKTGEPFGDTGLGDIYDHQFPILRNYKFNGTGPYLINLQQFMRTDTLTGILSVGVGVEKTEL